MTNITIKTIKSFDAHIIQEQVEPYAASTTIVIIAIIRLDYYYKNEEAIIYI